MEGIIIWIVFIAIGALWEFVGKKKSDSRSRSQSAAPAPARLESAPRSSTAVKTESAPRKAERPKPAYKPMHLVDAEPVAAVEIITDTPLPDIDTPSVTDTPAISAEQSAAQSDREAHFRRWRQAIIDTQVLERKF